MMATVAVAIVIGLALGSFVALLGNLKAPGIPPVPLLHSVTIGVVGAVLGAPIWDLLGIDLPEPVAQAGGALIALDLYIINARLRQNQ